MHEDYLKWFFKENGLDREKPPPAAAQAYIHIKLLLEDVDLKEIMSEYEFQELPGREEALLMEKEEIDSATTSEQLIHYMRRGADIMNQQALVRRALDFEDEIVPEIISMLKTSLNDLFIELSTRVLAVCGKDISDELAEIYDEVRDPYAKSMILVVMGFKADETRIPWLTKKFKALKLEYPNDDHCYGAFYALAEIEQRFYEGNETFSATQPGAILPQ